jgi:hypothetical protein
MGGLERKDVILVKKMTFLLIKTLPVFAFCFLLFAFWSLLTAEWHPVLVVA